MSRPTAANPYPRMSEIAESFPTLRGKPGVRPFDAERLAEQAPVASSGERHAIRFVLTVFNGAAVRSGAYEGLAVFDAEDALSSWDPAHRRAFVAWASAPWWP